MFYLTTQTWLETNWQTVYFCAPFRWESTTQRAKQFNSKEEIHAELTKMGFTKSAFRHYQAQER